MRKILVFVALAFIGNLFALDTIFKKKSEGIYCNVIGISSKRVIYYQEQSELLYPVFTIPKSDIMYILLDSGEKIYFKPRKKKAYKPKPTPIVFVDTAKIDTVKIDTIPIDTIEVDTVVLDSVVIDTVDIEKLIRDSIRIADSIEVEEILTVEIPKKREPIICRQKRLYTILAGYGFSSASFEQSGGSYSSTLGSFTAGAYRKFKFKSPFAIKFGVFFTSRKGEFEERRTNTAASYSYTIEKVSVSTLDLDFPVLINFSFDVGASKKFRLYTDLGARLSISLLRGYSSDLMAYNFATATPNYKANELSLVNVGGVASIGAEFNGKYVVEAKYDFDLTNRYSKDDTSKFSSVCLSGGINF